MVSKKGSLFRSLAPLSQTIAEKLNSDDSRNGVRLLIQLAVRSLEGKPIQEGALTKVQIKTVTCDELCELYALVLSVMKMFFYHQSSAVKPETLKDELKDLRFPNASAQDLASVLTGPRAAILSGIASKCNILPKLISVDWRINITIASCYSSRVLEPSVTLDISMSNNEKRQFEISVSKFHHLRYVVATVLKEMALLEKKRIFKMSVP
ncbi:COMM domain-containing protein 5-like [Schistocerca americana]|uniref:COMM domain-containing protein 5-like n=1 Tax=Schistocerca americana TaxID=7009 RepID=UPI001F4F1FA6|nr:COMM domain-containing protein 5-like [Schistocerca americana]XP_049953897.1 COMM domain-containing protein 5-like isoform X1 [Schistocerca serialis cubense]